MTIDLGAFDALTFDCYGTLIDWERGILAGMRPVLAAHRGPEQTDDELLERYARHEAELESGPYLAYREVIARSLAGVCEELDVAPGAEELARFGGSVGEWPAFPDSPAALARLHTRYRLGVLTNCDDDLFAASARRLGVEFDWVVTAQQAHGYKPREENFHLLLATLGLPRERVLHVAQSLFHDHVPAQRLGFSSVWIDRRGDRDGTGATPPAEAHPDLTFPDMASFAAAAVS